MVTVVDAVNFLKDYDQAKYLQDTGESLGEEDERSVADLLVDQVEFADVLLISKTDLVEKSDVERLTVILKTLNTEAQIIPIAHGKIAIDEVLDTGLFNFDRAQQAPGWLKEMRGEHVPETDEYGIGSFTYVARRPFYPEKFHHFLHNSERFGKLIDQRAFFGWLHVQNLPVSGVRLAVLLAMVLAVCFGKLCETKLAEDEDYLANIEKQWRSRLVICAKSWSFIGQGLNQQAMTEALDDCLLTDEDLLKGKQFWSLLDDPFPAWRKLHEWIKFYGNNPVPNRQFRQHTQGNQLEVLTDIYQENTNIVIWQCSLTDQLIQAADNILEIQSNLEQLMVLEPRMLLSRYIKFLVRHRTLRY